MRILVMGGTRYFGKRLVRLLTEDKHDVTVASRRLDELARSDLAPLVKTLSLDREDPSSVERAAKAGPWDIVFDQICYCSGEAQSACKAFSGRVGKYVHTSTGSTYPRSGERFERDFDPYRHPIQIGNREAFDYGEGKRQAEAVFFQTAKFPVVAMRVPIVLGPDDYSGRLEFHIDRIRDGLPIVVSNLGARTSLIHARETARFLYWLATHDVKGPINGCSDGTISIAEIIETIEARLGKKAVIKSNGPDEEHSVLVGPESRFNNNSLARSLGFQFEPIVPWFTELVEQLSSGRA